MMADSRQPARTSTDQTLSSATRGLMFQGWTGVAVWMCFGLFLEGLLAYKAPEYLGDQQRRELFRLAHAHGTLLSLVLVVASTAIGRLGGQVPGKATIAMRIGSLVMPAGFLLAGAWHPDGDPGLGIWLVPVGALLVIFGTTVLALASRKRPR